MRKVKRLLAAVLTVVMLATFFPTSVLAVEESETPKPGSEAVTIQNLASPQENTSTEPEQADPIDLDDLELYAEVDGEKVYLEPGISTYSLLPLEFHSYSLDLSNYFPLELKAFSVSDMVKMLEERYTSSGSGSIDSGKVAAWARWGFYDEDGNYVGYEQDDSYTLLGDDSTIDLSYGARQRGYYQMELIVGTADQLNPNNIRCRINVNVGYHYDLLEAEAYTADSPRRPITVYDESLSSNNNRNILYIPVEPETWPGGKEAHLGLKLGQDYSSLTAKVYEGYYETEEAIANAGATEITGQIMDQANLASAGGYQADYSWKNGYNGMPEVTFVLTRTSTGKTACVMPVILYMYPDELYVGISDLYASASGSSSAGNLRYNDKAGFDDYRICRLYSGYKADGTYYAYLYASDSKTQQNGANAIKGAYVGNYASMAEATAAGQTDIKAQLFNYSTRYAVDFSQYPNGVQFTVVDINDRVWHFGIEVEERQETIETLPQEPRPLSQDTYFRMESALKEKGGSEYNAYVMNYADDSYYYMGYQTVFLLDSSNNPVTAAEITPTFSTGTKVNVFTGHDVNGTTVGAEKQTSGETAIPFTSGEPIQYSATAESGKHLKNYFVTFLTQQAKPTLFVNGTNDESNYQEDPQDSTRKIPARVVNLTSDYNYHHDVFFANLGKTQLTGLKVELTGPNGTGEAENVKLDDYWTIGATTSLAGFTSTREQLINGTYDSSGELPNVGKIRLAPVADEDGKMVAGKISGLLTISADGVEPVRILLTGSAGAFQINTTALLDGVKYVSYSSLIQTNYISSGSTDTDAVSFTASGLPNGIDIKPNGELYGIPTTPGTYEVSVTATATIDGEQRTDTKTYTMVIADNEDAGVWEYDQSIYGDLNYTPLIAIPNENYDGTNLDTNTASSEGNSWNQPTMVLETQPEGEYRYFINRVFIDGVKLTEGVDYTSEPGSIKLTIQTQSLREFGNGTHTISAEARIGDSEDGSLRRVAQNYTLTTLGTSRPGGGSGGSSGGSGRPVIVDPPMSFTITAAEVFNGAVTLSRHSATSGTKITITLVPDSGFEPDGVSITSSDGSSIFTSKISDTEYTFTMPSGNVTVTASFQPILTPDLFTDIHKDDWFYGDVEYVLAHGLMSGVSASSFNPDGIASRAMLVTVLYNLEGKPEVSGTSSFSDVPAGQWYTTPITWAEENDLIFGLGDGTFGIASPLTREQVMTMLYRYAQMKGYDVTPSSSLSQFTDADCVSDFARVALQWACGAGLVQGYQDNLAPLDTATRAQLAAILRRFCESIAK